MLRLWFGFSICPTTGPPLSEEREENWTLCGLRPPRVGVVAREQQSERHYERTERARPQSRVARSPNSTLRCAWQGSVLIFSVRERRATQFLPTCFGMRETRCVPSDGAGVVEPRLAIQRTNAAKPFNFTFNLPANHVQVTWSLRSVYV